MAKSSNETGDKSRSLFSHWADKLVPVPAAAPADYHERRKKQQEKVRKQTEEEEEERAPAPAPLPKPPRKQKVAAEPRRVTSPLAPPPPPPPPKDSPRPKAKPKEGKKSRVKNNALYAYALLTYKPDNYNNSQRRISFNSLSNREKKERNRPVSYRNQMSQQSYYDDGEFVPPPIPKDELVSYQAGPTSSPAASITDDDIPKIVQSRPRQPRGRTKSRYSDPYEFFMNNYYRAEKQKTGDDSIMPNYVNGTRQVEVDFDPEHMKRENFQVKHQSEAFGPNGRLRSVSPRMNPRKRATTLSVPPSARTPMQPSSSSQRRAQSRGRSPAIFSRSRLLHRKSDEEDDLIKRLMGDEPPPASGTPHPGSRRDGGGGGGVFESRQSTPFPTDGSKHKLSIPSVGDVRYGGSGNKHDENAAISPAPSSSRMSGRSTALGYGDARPDYEKPGILSSGVNFLRNLGNSHRRHDMTDNRRIPSPMPGQVPGVGMDPMQQQSAFGSRALERPVGTSRRDLDASRGMRTGMASRYPYDEYRSGYYGDGYYNNNGSGEFFYRLFSLIPYFFQVIQMTVMEVSTWPPIWQIPTYLLLIFLGMQGMYYMSLVMNYFANVIGAFFRPWAAVGAPPVARY